LSTLDGIIPRGVPYEAENLVRRRPCVLNHGLWDNVPDFDAPTQMLHMRPRDFVWTDRTIPVGSYFPMCGMKAPTGQRFCIVRAKQDLAAVPGVNVWS
jgi:hypothetical protein